MILWEKRGRKKNECCKSFGLPAALLSYVRVCVFVTPLWTPNWKMRSPQERLYSNGRLMHVAEHMSNDVSSHLGSGSHYYHLHHEMTRGLIWSLNKLSQQSPGLRRAPRLHKIIYILESVGLWDPQYKWLPWTEAISVLRHVRDMVDVLPSRMWFLMWWASTSGPLVAPETSEMLLRSWKKCTKRKKKMI